MNFHFRKLALASLFAAGAAVAPQISSAAVDIEVGVAPPAVRYEVVPAPRGRAMFGARATGVGTATGTSGIPATG